MATVQSVGAAKPGGNIGMGDLLASMLESGILGNNQYNKEQDNKKQGNDDLIKAGLASKTVRPAKDGENATIKDSSGRGWVYDDSGYKELHQQADAQRKDSHWITIQGNVEKEIQQAINSGQLDGTNPAAVNAYRNQRIAQYLGVGADGKMSPDLKADLSPEGQQWVDSITKGAPAKSTNPSGTTYTPQMFMQHAGALSSMLGPQSPMGAKPAMPLVPQNSPGFTTGNNIPGQVGGYSVGHPGQGADPMAIIQHIIAQSQVPSQQGNWANQSNQGQ